MLLPSSASNPANMMAQALTMYKSMLGGVSNEKIIGSTPTSIGQIEGNDHSGEAKNKSSSDITQKGSPVTSTMTDQSEDNTNKPVFTLQSRKKKE